MMLRCLTAFGAIFATLFNLGLAQASIAQQSKSVSAIGSTVTSVSSAVRREYPNAVLIQGSILGFVPEAVAGEKKRAITIQTLYYIGSNTHYVEATQFG